LGVFGGGDFGTWRNGGMGKNGVRSSYEQLLGSVIISL